MRVIVFHNIASDEAGRSAAMSTGYRPGHPLVPVHETEVPEGQDPVDVANAMYQLFNVGADPERTDPPDPRAVTYRANRNRSMCKGDVLLIGDQWLACASSGWDVVPAPQWLAHGATRFGTTPLPRERWTLPLDYSVEDDRRDPIDEGILAVMRMVSSDVGAPREIVHAMLGDLLAAYRRSVGAGRRPSV